ncbi:hypothetical protein ACSSS7_003478 [Eimeria intestinalis]
MPADAAMKGAPEVALLREVTQQGALPLHQRADASVHADTVVNDETLQPISASYGSGPVRKTRLTRGVIAGTLVPFLVALGLLFWCKSHYRKPPVFGTQRRRLAEGSQEDDGLSEEELQQIVLECFETLEDDDISESSGDPSDLGSPIPADKQTNVYGEKLAPFHDLQQPAPVEGSAFTESKAHFDKGKYYSGLGTAPSSEGVWVLTDDDIRLGEQDFGGRLEGRANTEDRSTAGTTEEELSSEGLPPLRSAQKRKLPFEDPSDDEDQIITGEDFWWGQQDERERARRRLLQGLFAAPPPSTSRTTIPGDSPVTRGHPEAHPLVRLPRVRPGAVKRMLNFNVASSTPWRSTSLIRLLKKIRELLLMPELGSEEVEKLMATAEALIQAERMEAKGGDPGSRPSSILERLATVFMVYDALTCTMFILGQAHALEDEWKEFTALHNTYYTFPAHTHEKRYITLGVKATIQWIRRVCAALEMYKRGSRPPAREVIVIKRMIMSTGSIRRFMGSAGLPWRGDLEAPFEDKESDDFDGNEKRK